MVHPSVGARVLASLLRLALRVQQATELRGPGDPDGVPCSQLCLGQPQLLQELGGDGVCVCVSGRRASRGELTLCVHPSICPCLNGTRQRCRQRQPPWAPRRAVSRDVLSFFLLLSWPCLEALPAKGLFPSCRTSPGRRLPPPPPPHPALHPLDWEAAPSPLSLPHDPAETSQWPQKPEGHWVPCSLWAYHLCLTVSGHTPPPCRRPDTSVALTWPPFPGPWGDGKLLSQPRLRGGGHFLPSLQVPTKSGDFRSDS